jgi:hypothetical protein
MRTRDLSTLLLFALASTRLSGQATTGDTIHGAATAITHRLRTTYGSVYLGRLIDDRVESEHPVRG